MLTPEIVKELRKPFAPEQVKWKVQTNPKEGDDWAIVVAYVDARDVTERLDLASGGDWANEYTVPQAQAGAHHTLECRLTVCGVTRCDVGSVPPPREGDDATKDLYSDALKRAAVQFGVSSHIYRFPTVKAKVQKFGRSFFLTFKAQDELADLNRHLTAGKRWPKYTEIKVSGDSFGADGKPELFDDKPTSEGSSYTPPSSNGNGERPLVKRLRELVNECRGVGVSIPTLPKPKDMTDEQILEAIGNLETAKRKAPIPMEELPDMTEEWNDIDKSASERKVKVSAGK